MNEYDSNRISDLTKKINYTLTDNLGESDCYILNTCHIREKATDKVYHDIGRLKKEFRNKSKPIVLVTFCVNLGTPKHTRNTIHVVPCMFAWQPS